MVQPRRLQRCPLHVVGCPSVQALQAQGSRTATALTVHAALPHAHAPRVHCSVQCCSGTVAWQAMKLEAYQKIESLRAEYRWEGTGPHLRRDLPTSAPGLCQHLRRGYDHG